jgi:glucose-1-phosphate thymidylyltransferase
VRVLGRGTAWLDTGTHESLLQAGSFIETVEQRQGLKIGCIEEVAYRMGYIDRAELRALGESLGKSEYGRYLAALSNEEERA